jgi:excisionase family DNA binding protein
MKICEVADLLRVPPARAYELAREGVIPTVRIGRQVRVSAAALARWIEEGGQSLSDAERSADTGDLVAPRQGGSVHG